MNYGMEFNRYFASILSEPLLKMNVAAWIIGTCYEAMWNKLAEIETIVDLITAVIR